MPSRWLEEVLWAMQRQRLVFHRFEVRLRGDSLRASGLGEPVHPRHRPLADAQQLRLRQAGVEAAPPGWSAQCIVATGRATAG
jgi:SHS2 domain-containing protein